MIWINLFHFYQPPTITQEILEAVVNESYRPLLKTISQNKKFHCTVNINASLTWRLKEAGFNDIIKLLKHLASIKRVEFTETAAFHPLLPLIPAAETKKQIQINRQIHRSLLGSVWQTKTFFLPELAYTERVGQLIYKLGLRQIMLDEISYQGKIISHTQKSVRDLTTAAFNSPLWQTRFLAAKSKLVVIFRNRALSKTYVPQTILTLLKKEAPVAITATDAELYGHRHKDRYNYLKRLLANSRLKTMTITDYLRTLKRQKIIRPLAASWDTTEEDIKNKQPFALWFDRKNPIHEKLWQLAKLAWRLNEKYTTDPEHFSSRLHLERGLSSCTFWWASGRDFRLFGPPAWHPDEISKGAEELIRAIRTLTSVKPQTKLQAENLYLAIKKLVWTKHWQIQKL